MLSWEVPGGSAQVVRWLVAPGQPYAAGTALLLLRLRDGSSWHLADDLPGTFSRTRVGPGEVVHSGETVAAAYRTGVTGPRPVRARPATGTLVGLTLGALAHVAVFAAVPPTVALVLLMLSGTVFATLAVAAALPRRLTPPARFGLILLAVVVNLFLITVVGALLLYGAGYDTEDPTGLGTNVAGSVLLTALMLAVYGLWAWLRFVRARST
jgi:hypothetical protein